MDASRDNFNILSIDTMAKFLLSMAIMADLVEVSKPRLSTMISAVSLLVWIWRVTLLCLKLAHSETTLQIVSPIR